MSRKLLKVLVLGAMLVSGLASASTASAWTTNGPVNFTATGGASNLVVMVPVGHVAAHNVGVSCTGSSGTGTLNRGIAGSGVFDPAGSVTPAFTGCRIGINSAAVACDPAVLVAVSYNAGTDVTTGYIKSIRCTITVATCVITVVSSGTSPAGHGVDFSYNNTTGVFTIRGGFPSTQTLTASWPNTTACNNIFNTGTAGDPHAAPAYFGSSTQTTPGYPDDLVLRVTSTPIPTIRLP